MKRANFFSGIFIYITLFLTLSSAQELKIGFCDSDRVIKEYKGLSEAQQELDQLVKEWEEELVKKRKEIDSLKALYEKEKPSLSEPAKLEREKLIRTKEREYRGFMESIWGKNGKLQEKAKQITEPYYTKVIKTIEKIAKELEYALILDISKDMILYSSQKNDITDLVLEELNKEYVGIGETPGEGTLRKIKIAVFPFREPEPQLRATNLGEIFLSSIKSGIEKSTKFRVFSLYEIEEAMSRKGLTEENITLSDVKLIAMELITDYFVFGELKSKPGEIIIKADLYDQNGNKLKDFSAKTSDKENDLKISASSIAEQIIQYFSK